MKTVYPNRQLAHIWAQQTQANGRNASGSFYFDGPTIYSYGSHFPIATFTTAPNGARFVFCTADRYSATTAKHIGYVRSALYNLPGVSEVYHPGKPTRPPTEIMAALVDARETALEKAAKSRKYAAQYLEDADRLERSALALCDAFGISAPTFPPRDLDEIRARVAALAKFNRAQEAEKKERQRLEVAAALVEWRNYERATMPYYGGPAFLRLSQDGATVETSRGASVPASAAPAVWALVRRALETHDDQHPAGFRIGEFPLNRVTATGNLHAGCHFIEYAEVLAIVRQLGLTD